MLPNIDTGVVTVELTFEFGLCGVNGLLVAAGLLVVLFKWGLWWLLVFDTWLSVWIKLNTFAALTVEVEVLWLLVGIPCNVVVDGVLFVLFKLFKLVKLKLLWMLFTLVVLWWWDCVGFVLALIRLFILAFELYTGCCWWWFIISLVIVLLLLALLLLPPWLGVFWALLEWLVMLFILFWWFGLFKTISVVGSIDNDSLFISSISDVSEYVGFSSLLCLSISKK